MQFGKAPGRPVPVFHRSFADQKIMFHGKDSHFRLNFKALRQCGKIPYKSRAECPVTCHDVMDMGTENVVNQAADYPVADIVERAFIFFKICGRQSVSIYHICFPAQNQLYHFRCAFSRVSVVPIGNQITICPNFPKHASDYIPLALAGLITHDGTGFCCNFRCSVG